jgi:hypothetical protein
MLSFYLAFLYADKPYYNQFLDRILCISKFLFDVQQKNRLEQKGLLRRFSVTCYGHQESIEEMRAHKAEKYKILKQSKDKKEFEKIFLNYNPDTIKEKKDQDKTSKTSKTSKNKSSTTSKTSKNKSMNKKTKKNKSSKKKGNFLNIY